MNDFTIRNVTEEDYDQVGELDLIMKLYCLYHGDFQLENMVAAVNGENQIIGAAILKRSETFGAEGHEEEKDYLHSLEPEIVFAEGEEREDRKTALLDAMKRRAAEIKKEYPGRRIGLRLYIDSDQCGELSFYLKNGFLCSETVLVFRYDLSRKIPDYPVPASVTVKPYRFTEELLKEYHAAENAAFDGAAWTVNNLRWMQGAEEMANFGAFAGDELIGNTSTWKINDVRSATENVFVKQEWQKQGVARAVIAAALNHLKEQGKEMATLGTSGMNKKAIRLYLQVGYELAGTRQAVTFEIL